MYPMRPRMTKDQAKVIILVIWSAALLTSLPTAILSKLIKLPRIYTSHNQTQSFNSSSQAQGGNFQPIIHNTTSFSTTVSSNSSSSNNIMTSISIVDNSETLLSNKTVTTPTNSIENTIPNFQESTFNRTTSPEPTIMQPQYELGYDSEIPTCTENWTSAEGKYYYSMALMILQYILPLLVLVITYTRIVIVVWGKTIPGEEDNVRDARIARSKRKVNRNQCYIMLS